MNYRNPIPLTESLVRDSSKMIESDLVSAFLYLSPGTQLIDVTGICVTILDPGRRNQNEGPDIKNAVIAVDGIKGFTSTVNSMVKKKILKFYSNASAFLENQVMKWNLLTC
jgi:hypothetical protein